MTTTPSVRPPDFGRRKHTAPDSTSAPTSSKRSAHVGLLLMGVVTVGGGAYALMPSEQCDPAQVVNFVPNQTNVGCPPPRSSSSSSGYYGSHSNWSDQSSSSSRQSLVGSNATDSSAAHSSAIHGGFGSIARSFASHFSGGG